MSPIPVRGSVLLLRFTNHCWNTVSQILTIIRQKCQLQVVSDRMRLCVPTCGLADLLQRVRQLQLRLDLGPQLLQGTVNTSNSGTRFHCFLFTFNS